MPITDTASLIISAKAQGTADIDRMGKSLTGLDGFAKKAIGTLGSLFAVSKIVQFGKESVKTFSDLQEETNKFNVVFQGLDKRTSKILDDLKKNFGASELSGKRMLAATGDMLTGFGFGREQALDFAEAAAKLGADLASFSNYAGGAEGATTALTKAMLGEAEMVKSLGIVINQETDEYKAMKQQALTTGVTVDALGKTFKASSEAQAKAIVAIAMAYKQSPNAIGDFVRSQDSIANQSRILANTYQDLQTSVGWLLNSFVDFGAASGNLVGVLQKINNEIRKNGMEWVFMFQSVFIEISAGAQRAFAILSFALGPVVDAAKTGAQNILEIGTWLYGNFETIIANFPKIVVAVLKDIWESIKASFVIWVKFFNTLGQSIYKAIKAGLTGKSMFDAFKQEWQKFGEDYIASVGKIGENTKKALKEAGTTELNIKTPKTWWGEKEQNEMKKSLDEIDKQSKDQQDKLKKNYEKYLEEQNKKGKKGDKEKKEETAAKPATRMDDFSKELMRSIMNFRATAVSAVSSRSTEAIRLQSRTFLGSGLTDTQKQIAETKKISASNEKISKLTEKLVGKMDSIESMLGGLKTSSVGG